jgi:glycosyltransferase involved in cell wall biosynthesis
MLNRRAIKLDTRGYDFLIVQGPRPFRTSPETRTIVRYHDMIPVLHPDTRPSPIDIQWHHLAIKRTPPDAVYVCNSEPTRDDLTSVYPQFRERSETIPYILADVYRPQANPEMLRSIIDVRRSRASDTAHPEGPTGPMRYLLCVSTLEPRKNFVGLIQAYNALRARCSTQPRVRDLKLVIVGSPGWEYEPILAAMRRFIARGDLIHLEHVPADELRVLYTHAEAFVFPSHAEGFGFPPLEAMACDTPVIASDVPAHRWVLGDAAMYCDPNDSSTIVAATERLLASDESGTLRTRLVTLGRERVKRYSFESCASKWVDLLHCWKDRAGAADPAQGASRPAVMDQAA